MKKDHCNFKLLEFLSDLSLYTHVACLLLSSDIECMGKGCNVIITEEMALQLISLPQIKDKYQRLAFESYINVC